MNARRPSRFERAAAEVSSRGDRRGRGAQYKAVKEALIQQELLDDNAEEGRAGGADDREKLLRLPEVQELRKLVEKHNADLATPINASANRAVVQQAAERGAPANGNAALVANGAAAAAPPQPPPFDIDKCDNVVKLFGWKFVENKWQLWCGLPCVEKGTKHSETFAAVRTDSKFPTPKTNNIIKHLEQHTKPLTSAEWKQTFVAGDNEETCNIIKQARSF